LTIQNAKDNGINITGSNWTARDFVAGNVNHYHGDER